MSSVELPFLGLDLLALLTPRVMLSFFFFLSSFLVICAEIGVQYYTDNNFKYC